MAVTVACPSCSQTLPVGEEILGKKIRCKACQEVFVATAVKVKVGGGQQSSDAPRSPSRNGSTNGVQVKSAPKAVESKGTNKGLIIGGGVALVAAAAVMVWALFLRGDGSSNSDSNQRADQPASTVPKIKLSDTATVSNDKTNSTEVTPNSETPKNTQPTVTTQVSQPKKPLMAGFAESPQSVPPSLDKELLEKVKQSAVMIRVFVQGGAGEGSGWFAEPGIIVTNSHVVGMLDPAAPPPHAIRVFLYMGQPGKQREITGKLLAIDRENDLAVISVQGHKNLPDPLPICPSNELHDGQQLHIMGFPLGSSFNRFAMAGNDPDDQAETTLKIRNTTVAGRVFFTNGGVKYVQVEGGADHGNSGGAVFDNAGYVRTVLVAGIPETNMRFTIPSEYAVYLLQGRILNVVPGQPYNAGAGARMPITAHIADPMHRIKKVTLEVWAGDKGSNIRPMSDRRPSPLAGDSSRSEAELAYEADQVVRLGASRPATAEVDLPPAKPGQVYWIQPRYERIDGSTRWGEAIATQWSGNPVDRRSANLVVKHQSGSERYVRIQSRFGQGFVPEGMSPVVRPRELRVKMTEKTRNVEYDGSAKVRLDFDDVDFGDRDMTDFYKDTITELTTAAKGMSIEYIMTNRGLIKSPKPNMQGVTQEHRFILENFGDQIIQSLESLALALPDKDVAAGDTWGFNIPHTFFLPQNKKEEASYRMRFKYLGSRTRNGRDEAVVTFEGFVTKGEGGGATAGDATNTGDGIDKIDEESERRKGIFGYVRGSALVDLQTGMTSLAQSHADVVISFKLKVKVRNRDGNEEEREIGLSLGALAETTLQRDFSKNAEIAKAEALLPGLPFSLNPFVGAPDGSIASKPTSGNSNSTNQTPGMTGVSQLQMPDEVRDRIKMQGCLIRTKSHEGGGDGSGWLAEPGIVVTNAHVVGMLDPASRPPISVDVHFNAGTPQEKQFPAKILLVDHDNDLAVLELPTKEGLPDPMPIVPSTYGSEPLIEGQRLSVVGFPHGFRIGGELGTTMDPLAVQIKLRETSVAGRVENKRTGLLKYIQVEGGLIHGNSGGAIVDMNGAVRCVAVRIVFDVDTGNVGQLGLAIPSEYAARLLAGFPLKTEPKMAYMDGSLAKMPVEIKFGDPLRRVSKVNLDYWVGKPGLPRRNSKTAPKARSDDSPRQSVEMNYDPKEMKATGEFVLPDVDPGTAYWVQPRYIDGSGKEVWGDAIYFAPDGPPTDRKPVKLEARFPKGGGQMLDLNTEANYRYIYLGTDYAEETNLVCSLRETYLGYVNLAKGQVVTYQYENLSFGLPRTMGQYLRTLISLVQGGPQLLVLIRNVVSTTVYSKDGVMQPNAQVNLQGTTPNIRQLVKEFNDQVLQSIQLLTIRMPNKIVEYGETWEQPTNLMIQTRNRADPALFTLTMKYLGKRDRGGRTEAVVEIKGSVARDQSGKSIDAELKTQPEGDQPEGKSKGKGPAPKDKGKSPGGKGQVWSEMISDLVQAQLPPSKVAGKKPLYGDVKGFAYIDVESGHVSRCKLFVDIDVEVLHVDQQTKAQIPVRAGGTLELELTRRSSIR